MSWKSVSIARPLVGRPQCALGENAGDMALIVRRGMNAATRIDHRLHGRCDIADSLFARRMSDENFGSRTCIDRRLAYPTKCHTDMGAFILFAQRHHHGHADNGKVTAPACDLHETATGARL